jgi:spore maturation protein CgeB
MDEMLSLPHSLQDGKSVVFFRSLDELQELAMYYLQHTEERLEIARNGWEICMRKHRSWHRLEEMLFGRGITKTVIEDSWFPNITAPM